MQNMFLFKQSCNRGNLRLEPVPALPAPCICTIGLYAATDPCIFSALYVLVWGRYEVRKKTTRCNEEILDIVNQHKRGKNPRYEWNDSLFFRCSSPSTLNNTRYSGTSSGYENPVICHGTGV